MQDASIAAIRARLQAAADAHVTGEPFEHPLEDVPAVGPVALLRTRLGLTDTEWAVLWLLVAHELCPTSRRLVRELNSEPVPDPTLDAIRRVIYRGTRDPRAWRELGRDGALHRLSLIEWTDGNPALPDHRRTLRASSRVLALVHDDLDLDRELA
ncbi:MAG TPA: hypothetical protein VK427_06315, partial [Kofleriaceae bacterium]|nr:hypothetical protein [Kofleriaceae bacterium]